MCMNICTYIYMYIKVHMCVCVSVCLCVCVSVSVSVSVCLCVCGFPSGFPGCACSCPITRSERPERTTERENIDQGTRKEHIEEKT